MKRNILLISALVLFAMMPFGNAFGQDCESCQAGLTENYKSTYGFPHEINALSGNVLIAITATPVLVDQGVVVTSGYTLTIDKTKLMFKTGFGIEVQSGGTLIIKNGSEVTGVRECHSGWNGIEVQTGGSIVVEANPTRSLIGNMVNGIVLHDGTSASITSTDFINNIVGINTKQKSTGLTLEECYFDTYHAPSIDWVWPFECPTHAEPIVFAEIEESTDFTIGPGNEMRTATYGIRIGDNSDKITVDRNRIFNVRHKVWVESSSNITVSDNDLASLRPISNFPYNALNTDDEDAIIMYQVDGFDVTCNRITHYNQLPYASTPLSLPEVTAMGIWTQWASEPSYIEDNEVDNTDAAIRFSGDNADVAVKNNILSNYTFHGLFIDDLSTLNPHGNCVDIASHVNMFDQSGITDVQCDNPNYTFGYYAPPSGPFTPTSGGYVIIDNTCPLNETPALSCNPGVERLAVAEEVVKSEISIYPNPASSMIAVDLSKLIESMNAEQSMVRILDLTGRELIVESVNQAISTIDISSLNPAIYLVQVVSNGEIISSDKLLVK